MGPMVIAVTCIKKNDEEKLSQIGVKDSKILSEKERERQFAEIVQVVSEFSFVRIDAAEIDELRDRKSLNEVEAMRIGQLLNGLKTKPDQVYVDSPDPISSNFAKRIRKYINFDPIIKAEHKADVNYLIVGAASISAASIFTNENSLTTLVISMICLSRSFSESILLSLTPISASLSSSFFCMHETAMTIGPTHGHLPASSTPAMRIQTPKTNRRCVLKRLLHRSCCFSQAFLLKRLLHLRGKFFKKFNSAVFRQCLNISKPFLNYGHSRKN